MKRLGNRLAGEQDGYVIIVAALAMAALLGAAAWTFDGGRWHRDSLRLQATADSAALAGATKLPSIDNAAAVAAATTMGNLNLTQPNNGDVGTGQKVDVTVTKSPGSSVYDTVQVTASDTQSGTLSKAIGINSSNRFRTAVARVSAVQSFPSGLLSPIIAYSGDVANWPTDGETTFSVPVTKPTVPTPGNFDVITLPGGTVTVSTPNPATWLESNPGAGKMHDAINQINAAPPPVTIYMPVYDATNDWGGRNARFHIIGFAAFRVSEASWHGNDGEITGQFIGIAQTAGTGSPGQTNFGLTALNLIQ